MKAMETTGAIQRKQGIFRLHKKETGNIKPLPERLFRRGVHYSQVKRTESVALYSLSYQSGGRIIGFDVFKVHRIGERAFRGKIIPPYEQFPLNTDYGRSVFSFTTLQAAEEKFLALNKRAGTKSVPFGTD